MSSFVDNTPHGSSPTAKAARDAARKAVKASWSAAQPFPITSDPSLLTEALATALRADSIVDAALALARHGVPVFPVSPDDKKPLNGHGIYSATTDPNEIDRLWKRHPIALIGVPMGHRTGLFAVDVDASPPHAHDGVGAWRALEAMLDVHQQAIAALMKPDASGFCGLDYHKVCRERFDELPACGADRDNARAQAFEGTLNLWLDREFERTARTSSLWSCAHCGRPEGDTVLLPIGWGDSHHWLHGACYEAWRAARRAKAVKALAQYEIAENRPLDRWFIPSI